MSYQNELTPAQVRNFKRRARFIVCGEPADVFHEATPPRGMFVATLNHTTDNTAVWYEDEYGDEISPAYLAACRKVSKEAAQVRIIQMLDLWATYPDGTINGMTSEQVESEARRIMTT